MSSIIADIILIGFIFLLFRAFQFENAFIIKEAENANVWELLLSSVFVIGGFCFLHILIYGINANDSWGSKGIIFIVCYELIGMFIFLLFKGPFIAFLKRCDSQMPFLLKIPVACEFLFCCYLLAMNIL